MQLLDLASAEEGLVDSIAFTPDHHRRRTGLVYGMQVARLAVRLRRSEQSLPGVKGLLRAAAANVEHLGGASVDGWELVAEQPRHGTSETVDGLIRITDHHQAWMGFRRCQQLKQLELGGVHILELVNQDQPEMRTQPVAKDKVRLQQLDRAADQVTKVEHATPLHASVVCLVGGGENSKPFAGAGFGRQQQGGRMDDPCPRGRCESPSIPETRRSAAAPDPASAREAGASRSCGTSRSMPRRSRRSIDDRFVAQFRRLPRSRT